MRFLGFAPLGSDFVFAFLTKNSSGQPKDTDTLATFRAYSSTALMPNGTGSAAKLNTGSITGATNATPIVITSANHGLTTGTRVVVASVGGNTAANGEWTVTNLSGSTFSLNTSVGNGAYTSGGDWHVAGLYTITIPVTQANTFERGKTYYVVATFTIAGGSPQSEMFSFTVV